MQFPPAQPQTVIGGSGWIATAAPMAGLLRGVPSARLILGLEGGGINSGNAKSGD